VNRDLQLGQTTGMGIAGIAGQGGRTKQGSGNPGSVRLRAAAVKGAEVREERVEPGRLTGGEGRAGRRPRRLGGRCTPGERSAREWFDE
jgi:hypothetical protein